MLNRLRKKFVPLCFALLLLPTLAAATADAAPFEVETQAATSVGSYSATLNGRVNNPNGLMGLAGYQYGTTNAYGSETSGTSFSEKGWVSVPAGVEGLAPNTTYHYRVGSVNGLGETSFGEDATFTTLPRAKFMSSEATYYPLDVSLESSSVAPLSFGIEGGTFSCEALSGSASITAGDVLFRRSAEVALTAVFEGCAALSLSAEVSTNGCTVVLTAGDPGTATGAVGIACPEGKAIDIAAGSCKFSLPAQSGLGPVTETNAASPEPGHVDVEPEVTGLEYVKTHDGFLCPFSGTGAESDGSLSGSATLKGAHEGSPAQLKIGY